MGNKNQIINYKTLDLKGLVEKIRYLNLENYQIKMFLNEQPLKCNYKIITCYHDASHQIVCDINKNFEKQEYDFANLKFKDHINLNNLSYNCELIVNENQLQIINYIERLVKIPNIINSENIISSFITSDIEDRDFNYEAEIYNQNIEYIEYDKLVDNNKNQVNHNSDYITNNVSNYDDQQKETSNNIPDKKFSRTCCW